MKYSKAFIKTAILLTAWILTTGMNEASAQPGTFDPTFNSGDAGLGFGDGTPTAFWAEQNDGKFLVTTTKNNLIRLNADGSPDATFSIGTGPTGGNPNSAPYIIRIAIQSDGKIIIAGAFSRFNGIDKNGLVRLHTDGSVDTSFDPGTGIPAGRDYLNVEPLSNGKILIAGDFSTYNGATARSIARLNSDGTIDDTFTSAGEGNINDIELQSDGKIIIGGGFNRYGGVNRKNIARLSENGVLDTTFDPGTGPDDEVLVIELQGDNKILVGGLFRTWSGISNIHITRLNTDGTQDASFSPSPIDPFGNVESIIWMSDGGILLAGSSLRNSTTGTPISNILLLNSNGSLNPGFNISLKNLNQSLLTTTSNFITKATLLSTGKIVITTSAISFNYVNGEVRRGIALLNIDGTLDPVVFDPGPGSGVNGGVVFSTSPAGEKIIIGGGFTRYNNSSRNRIARLNADGNLDNAFNPGTGANDIVRVVQVQPDNKVLAGGEFTSFNGTSLNRIVRLNEDGTIDNSFNIGTGANEMVRAIAVQPADNKIIIAGDFTAYNGTTKNGIVRLNPDGSIDDTFTIGAGAVGSGAAARIFCMLLQGDGKIIIAGSFTRYSGIVRSGIARLNPDGTLDTSFNPAAGPTFASISNAAFQTDEKLIVSGNFTSINGTPVNHVAMLNIDGSLDIDFNPGTGINTAGSIRALKVFNEKIYIGGTFTSFDGTPVNGIARLNTNGSPDTSFDSGTGINTGGSILSINVQNSELIIGGNFLSYNDFGRNRIARVFTCTKPAKPVITADFNNYEAPTLTSSSTSGNQWFFNGNPVNGANTPTLQISEAGLYTVNVTLSGCISNMSDVTNIVITGTESEIEDKIHVSVFPNPAHEVLTLSLSGFQVHEPVAISITDMQGRTILNRNVKGLKEVSIDVRQYLTGMYIIKTRQNATQAFTKFIKK